MGRRPPLPCGVAELTPQGKPSSLPAPRLSACAKALADRRQTGSRQASRGRGLLGKFQICLGLRFNRPDGTFVLPYLHPAMNRRAIVTDALSWGIRSRKW